MNSIDKILLRLSILIRKKLGYRIPQLNEARPIKTSHFAIYRHHGRLMRLEPMTYAELREVSAEQDKLDVKYMQEKIRAREEWIAAVVKETGIRPGADEIDEWAFRYECEHEREEYRPCEKCIISPLTPGDVLPCPYYNVIEGSTHHACCTHKYVIIKDVEKL